MASVSVSLENIESGYLYDKVVDLIGSMIDQGALKPGDKVPSLRRMSQQLGVSISTVMQGYERLERQGRIHPRPQSGFYVSRPENPRASLPRPSRPRAVPREIQVSALVETLLLKSRDPSNTPLGLSQVSASLLPLKTLNRFAARVATTQVQGVGSYAAPTGFPELREQIARRYAANGHAVSPKEIIITAGASEALAVSLGAVVGRGGTIAVESPTYFVLLQIIEELGIKAVEIPMDASGGMHLDALEQVLCTHSVDAILTMPNFHNPYGSLMSDSAKGELVSMASKHGAMIIEDDIYGDLHFDDRRPPTLGAMDNDGRVLTCSSFSKTLAPGYRVGWILTGMHRDRLMRRKTATSLANASITQLAVVKFLQAGHYDRHVRRLRRTLKAQVEDMRLLVERHFPAGTRVSNPRGGLVLWVEMTGGVDAEALFEEALGHGISIMPGTVFSPTRKYRHCIRVSCGNPVDAAVENAVKTLGELAGAAVA